MPTFALTWKRPAVALAVAVTEATPLDPKVAVVPESAADAPLDGAVKVTMPPATGSTALLGVTVTASGLAKADPVLVDCPVLSATAVRVNP